MSNNAPLPARPRGVAPRRLGALLAALAWSLLLVAPALAAMGPTKLESPLVSPTSGTPDTTIVAEVTYRTHNAQAPLYVRVRVGESVHDMTATSALDYRTGVRYRWSGRLAVGTYAITFLAADSEKFVDELPAGSVTIALPPPPTPTPTDAPGPANPPPGGGSEPGGSSTPTDGPTPGTSGAAADGPTSALSAGGVRLFGLGWLAYELTAATGGGDDNWPFGGSGTDPGSGSGSGAAAPTDGGGGDSRTEASDLTGGPDGDPATSAISNADADGASDGGWLATLARQLRDAGADPIASLLPGGGGTTLPMLTSAVGSAAAVAVWMAFSLFGKRRRDETPPAGDDVLHASAATGIGLVPSSGLVPEAADPELLLPRWRRPSLLQARKFDPIREGLPERASVAFGSDTDSTHERRRIRYATVRLLDRPDELMGLAVSDLAAGDEVELYERSGLYWFVRTPDGRAGWLHRMTLGEVVSAATADDGFAAVPARALR